VVRQIMDERDLWVVRHGQTTWNSVALVQGQDDTATLTPEGYLEAERLAERFVGQPVGAIYSSDLRRARQTAGPLAAVLGLTVRIDPLLRERNFGIYQGGPVSALQPGVTGVSHGRVVDSTVRPPDGESLDDVYQRAATFIDRLVDDEPMTAVVVMAHGGSVRAIRAYCAGLPMQDLVWDDVPNASVWPARLPSSPALADSALHTEHGGVR
jgi:broad specificity phosphatase PhoE